MNNIWGLFCATFLLITACILISCRWSGSKARSSSDELSVKQQDAGSLKDKRGALEVIVEHVTFDYFNANDVPLSEVLPKIENRINQTIAPSKVRVTTINPTDGRITIVLRGVKVKTLLDLIADQTGYNYRLDNERFEIRIYYAGDTIGD